MLLQEFNSGWKDKFEHKVQTLIKTLPNIEFKSVKRYRGMLRLEIQALDKDVQFVVDCVTYVIERESAKTCENCGKYGLRRTHDEWMKETKCLCLPCYTMEIDNTISQQNNQ